MSRRDLYSQMVVPVDLCCNNPHTGLFEGRVAALHVGRDADLELYSHRIDWGPRLRYIGERRSGCPARIAIARKQFPVVGYKYGYGNWCWDRVDMPGEAAIELLNWLRPKGWFDLDAGEERLWNLWRGGHDFDRHCIRILAK